MDLTLSQWLVIGICAVLVLGYILGYYYNRQQAVRILTWLQAGMEKWGAVSMGEKLPGMVTGGRLVIQKARAPFQRIEAVYLLAPRENLFFWLFNRLQGRGDELVLKINLSSAPKIGMEASRRGHSNFTFHGQGAEEKWAAFLAQHVREFIHLAVRHEAPHLFVRAYLPALMADDAGAFLSLLSGLVS